MDKVRSHEEAIIQYTLERLSEVPELTLYGPEAEKKGAVATFTFANIHPHDLAQMLDAEGIAIRAGHHCAMPLHDRFHLPATARASLYLYNKLAEVDALVEGLYKAKKAFTL
jgi:cysteine desulfurase/selenocysteine lyase